MISQAELISKGYHSLVHGIISFFRDSIGPFKMANGYNTDYICLSISGNFTCLQVTMFMVREYGFYLLQNYVPSCLLVVLSWVSFWINIDAVPARISVGVLTVLTMTTQSVGVWMSLPVVSYVKVFFSQIIHVIPLFITYM